MIRKILLSLAFIIALTADVYATDVTISAAAFPGFNPAGIGNDRTISVTVTNGSPTVTSSAAFPPNTVGLGGFRVKIGSTFYTVASVDTTSSLTLTTNFSGSSGGATMVFYRWVEWRFYANQSFTPLGANYVVQPGAPGSGAWFRRFAASVVTESGTTSLYVPQLTIPATTDATDNNTAKWTIGVYRPDGSQIPNFFLCSSNVSQLAIPPTTPTTYTALCAFNSPAVIVPAGTSVYNKAQIDARFPSCSTPQMLYYAATGNALSCLTVGSGLQISGGAITATGGGGGGGMAIGGAITSATEGSVLFAGAGGVLAQNNSSFFWNNTDGRLGLGINSALGARLHAKVGASGDGIRVDSNSGAVNSTWTSDGTSIFFGATSAHPLVLRTNNTERARIDSAGLVGIGQATPTAQLHVTSGANGTVAALIQGTASASADLFQVQKGSANRLTLSQDGILTLGQASTVAGQIKLANASNSNLVTIQPGVTGSSFSLTLPTSLPASTQCLQVSNTGVISTVACASASNIRQALNAVTDYGAVGDGVTNDTTAIQNCLNASAASGGKECYLPGTANGYLVTGLTLSDNMRLVGDGGWAGRTVIKSISNAPIFSVTTTAFNAGIRGVKVQGNVAAGSSQIGIELDGSSAYWGFSLRDVWITDTGSNALKIVEPFSSSFQDIYLDNAAAYPLLYDAPNRPTNTFINIYVANLRSTATTGFRIKSGYFQCTSCNGVNNIVAGSWWGALGKKNGVDGDTSDSGAFMRCENCNLESWVSKGLKFYSNSTATLDGKTLIAHSPVTTTLNGAINNLVTTITVASTTSFPSAGKIKIDSEVISYTGLTATTFTGCTRGVDGTAAASHSNGATVTHRSVIPLDYEVITADNPDFFPPGYIADTVVFGTAPETNFDRDSAVWSTGGNPPLETWGRGAGINPTNSSAPLATYWDETASRVNPLRRADGGFKRVTITGTTTLSRVGIRLIEANCAAACTITLPWPGWYKTGEAITIRDVSGAAATNNITVQVASAGTINGAASYTINRNNESITVIPNDTATDWRVVVDYPGGRVPFIQSGGTPNLNYFTQWSATTGELALSGAMFQAGADVALTGRIIANTDNTVDIGTSGGNRFRTIYAATSFSGPKYTLSGNINWTQGAGSPEGVVTADIGAIYSRNDGSAGATFYVKESGSGNTGWSAVLTSGGGGGITGSLTSGRVPYATGASTVADTANFTWTNASNLLTVQGHASITQDDTAQVPFTVRAKAASTAELVQIKDSGGSVRGGYAASGAFFFRGFSSSPTVSLANDGKLFYDITGGVTNQQLLLSKNTGIYNPVVTANQASYTSTRLPRWSATSWELDDITGATSDGTNVTFGSGNLRATRPRVTTSLDDANGNESIILTATGSAVNEITLANAATGNPVRITASGGDSNVSLNINPKGTGGIGVNMGTTAPTAILHVKARATSNEGIQVDSNSGAVTSLWTSDGSNVYFGSTSAHTLEFWTSGTTRMSINSSGAVSVNGSFGASTIQATTTIRSTGVAFASLGTPSNGTLVYCTDCTKATPCASGGSGALAVRLNGAWDCNP